MYTDHFKLSDKPFSNSPSDGFFTPNEEFESAVARMEQVLVSRDAVAVVTGGPGVGKTTIVATAAKRAGDKALVTYVDMRQVKPDLLFDLLLLELGGESGAGDQATSLFRLKSAIARHNEEQSRKVTAVIDISTLTIERAKRILQLVHMAGEPDSQLNVVLLGPHILHKLLDTPGLIHMRQHVTFRHRARPLTAAETEAYLKAQLEQSGGQVDSILSHGTSIKVYQYVGGVPRLINTLMDAALSHVAAKGGDSITAESVTEVAQLLGWRRLAGKKSAAPKKSKAARKATKSPQEAKTHSPNEEELSPLELSVSDSSKPDVVEKSPTKPEPVSEGTAMLMAAAFDSETAPSANDKPQQKPENIESKQDHEAKETSVPEMDPVDTSATGILRLEDLDARFAETIFGEDPALLNIEEDAKKAAG